MKKKHLLALSILVILSFSMIFTACQGDVSTDVEVVAEGDVYPMEFIDSAGRKVILEKQPERIISVGPNVTEVIYALNKQDKLVGRTDFCDFPEEVENIESIGTLRNPSIEKIIELKPDLVIGSAHFPQEVMEQLENLGINTVGIYRGETFEGVYEMIGDAGKLLNATQRATEIVEEMKETVSMVTEAVEGREKPSVYYVIGFGKSGDFTAGSDTFIAEMIRMAGGKNIADEITGWSYSLERILEQNPEIVICSDQFNTKEEFMSTEGYKQLDAVKNNKLFEMNTNLVDRQGPRLAQGLKEIAKILHPDAF